MSKGEGAVQKPRSWFCWHHWSKWGIFREETGKACMVIWQQRQCLKCGLTKVRKEGFW